MPKAGPWPCPRPLATSTLLPGSVRAQSAQPALPAQAGSSPRVRDQGLGLACCMTQGSGARCHVSPALRAGHRRASERLEMRQRECQAMALTEAVEPSRGHRMQGNVQLGCSQGQPGTGAVRTAANTWNHPQTLGNWQSPQKFAWVRTPGSSGSRNQVCNTYFDNTPGSRTSSFPSPFHIHRCLWDLRKLHPSPAALYFLSHSHLSAMWLDFGCLFHTAGTPFHWLLSRLCPVL